MIRNLKNRSDLFVTRSSITNKNSKTISTFRPMILSRHPSHDCLRSKHKNIALLPYKSVVRLGSTTDLEDTISNGGNRIEINTVQSIKNSANKLLMKQKFNDVNVKTAEWVVIRNNSWCNYSPGYDENMFDYNFRYYEYDGDLIENCPLEYPIVAKSNYGSKGKGNTLLKTKEDLMLWMQDKVLSNYIFEKFYNYAHEFRLHVTQEGCFYSCRKALKADVPEDQKWRRHDDVCVWFLEENEYFFKPNSWEDIVEDCVLALNSIGADILSFDVKVQSPMTKNEEMREYQDYILLECNSASSMNNGLDELSICAKKYINEIRKLIINKSKKY